MTFIRQTGDTRKAPGLAPCSMCQVGDGTPELNGWVGRYWYLHRPCGNTTERFPGTSVADAEMYWNRANGRRRSDRCNR